MVDDEKRTANILDSGRKSNFAAVNRVLSRVMDKLGLEKRLREHTVLTLWQSMVPGPLLAKTRPLFIDADRNLVVAVADASVGQELSMHKMKILQELGRAARTLGVELRGIRPDLKNYHKQVEYGVQPEEPRLPEPTDAELEALELTMAEKAEVERLAASLPPGDAVLNKRIIRVFENGLKLRTWQLANNYPICSRCSNPCEKLHRVKEGGRLLDMCHACFYSSQPGITH